MHVCAHEHEFSGWELVSLLSTDVKLSWWGGVTSWLAASSLPTPADPRLTSPPLSPGCQGAQAPQTPAPRPGLLVTYSHLTYFSGTCLKTGGVYQSAFPPTV